MEGSGRSPCPCGSHRGVCSGCTRCVFAQQERAPPSSATIPRPLCGACRPGLCKACWTLTTSAPERSPRWPPWSTLSRESCHGRKAADGCQVAFSHLISLTETELGEQFTYPLCWGSDCPSQTGASHIPGGSFPVDGNPLRAEPCLSTF